MIEYADLMSEDELQDFFQSIYKSYNDKQDSAELLLYKNESILNKAYYKHENEQIKIYSDQKEEIIKSIAFWDKKECICGNKLKLIESQNGKFWGCSNYLDKSKKHKTFSENEREYLVHNLKRCRIRINSHWATFIIKEVKLEKFIKAKQLITFYTNLGYVDLREKYGYKPTVESISGYVNAKINSKKEEIEITEYLTNFFPKSKSQIGIKYKLENQNSKVAIIDLIISNNQTVYIVEIKRTNYDIKIDQLELYFSLISFILTKKKDSRKCKALFIVYNKETYSLSNDEKYIEFKELKKCENIDQIIKKLEIICKINGS